MVKEKERDIWQELKQHLMEKISEAGSYSNDFGTRSRKATEDQITPAGSYFAFASMTYQQFFDIFILLDNAFDYLLELEKRIEFRSSQLQRVILEMAEHSDVHMTYLTKRLQSMASKVDNPMLERIDQFLKQAKEAEDKRKTLGNQYVG